MDETPIVACTGVAKSFGRKQVLAELDFSVQQGEVVGLLGRNGSGKTTLLRLILGLTRPSAGTLSVMGDAPGHGPCRIGYLGEDICVYPHLTAYQNLRTSALVAGVRPDREKLTKVLRQVGLLDAGDRPARVFSLGMKRRLQLGMTMLVRPLDVMILDEPTSGLDASGLDWFKHDVLERMAAGITMVIASHDLSQLQEMISSYAVLEHGTIVKRGTWGRRQAASVWLKVDNARRARGTLAARGFEVEVVDSRRIRVITGAPATEVAAWARAAGIEVRAMGTESSQLGAVMRTALEV